MKMDLDVRNPILSPSGNSFLGISRLGFLVLESVEIQTQDVVDDSGNVSCYAFSPEGEFLIYSTSFFVKIVEISSIKSKVLTLDFRRISTISFRGPHNILIGNENYLIDIKHEFYRPIFA